MPATAGTKQETQSTMRCRAKGCYTSGPAVMATAVDAAARGRLRATVAGPLFEHAHRRPISPLYGVERR